MLGLLGAWFVIAVVNQTGARPRLTPRWLRSVSAVPNWRLFGPRPSVSDHELLYRDRLEDGAISDSHHVPLRQPRRASHVLWNPQNRSAKVLTDCVRALHEVQEHDPAADLARTVPYAVIARHVQGLPAPAAATHRQFIVARTTGRGAEREVHLALWSKFHPLRRRRGG